jgi:hypothetical protein
MSEPVPTEISIGGKIRAELVSGLCKAIAGDAAQKRCPQAKEKRHRRLLELNSGRL